MSERGVQMCDACWKEQHHLCGMQTWCECPCDGSPDWGIAEDEMMAYYEDDDD